MSKKRKKPKEKKIPIAKIQEGIELSLRKSLEHLDGAEALISKNLVNESVALTEFAIEEFGRGVILRDMLRAGLETIEGRLWYDHEFKHNAAFTELPKELATIWERIVPHMSAMIAGRRMSSLSANIMLGYPKRREIETISPTARLNAIFIDFDEKTQKWHNGIRANSKNLKLILDKLRENIGTFKV